jgi:hypothetical protein
LTTIQIGCIVEGHGEREAVPILIRRVVQEIDPSLHINILKPVRISRSKIVKADELERGVDLLARGFSTKGGILILLDSDDDCPAKLGPELLARATAARSDVALAVVLAKREYEAWFLASAEALRGSRGLSATLQPPPDPEAVRGAKEWLSRHMLGSHHYRETLDQPALTARFDLSLARRTPSFSKCYRDVARLVQELRSSDW